MQHSPSSLTSNENSRTSRALGRLAASASAPSRSQGPSKQSQSGGQPKAGHRLVELLSWVCSSCQRECIPIRSESRCLCGHRLKEHDTPNVTRACRCNHARCPCKSFFFIPAEGSWILRCRCKHRHTDHDPQTHACCKSGCQCDMFHSPWVCNCDHAWSHHKQVLSQKEVPTLQAMLANAHLCDDTVLSEIVNPEAGIEVNRWDLISRGDAA